MKVRKWLIIPAIFGSLGYYTINNYVFAADTSWLHGTWWYADAKGNIIEGKDKDGMLFQPNGTVDLIYGSGKPYLHCAYTAQVADEVQVKCEVRGKSKEMTFRVNKEHSKIANVDDKDGGGYVR